MNDMQAEFKVVDGVLVKDTVTFGSQEGAYGIAIHSSNVMAMFMLPIVQQVKIHTISSPDVDYRDVPTELHKDTKFPLEDISEPYHNSAARWGWVLDEVIFALSEHSTNQQNAPKTVQVANPGEDVLFTIGDVKYAMIPGGTDALIAYGERIQRGMQLFGKYYSHIGV